MKKTLLSTTGLILAVVLFVSFNIVVNGNFKSARVDLTENDLYTLSEGTLNILESLSEPITLRFYYTPTVAQALPNIKAYAQRVQEVLQEYQRASHGMLKLYIINPQPFSDDEKRARNYGLQSIPIEGEPDPLFFGLAGSNTLDGVEVMSLFQPDREDTLEYELTKLIYKLSDQERKSVSVISSLPVDGEDYDPLKGEITSDDGAKPWQLMEELRQLFDVRVLPTDIRRIPSTTDALIVIHPKELTDETLYAIDQYVLHGGKLISFVDPFAEVDIPKKDPDNPMAAMMASRSSDMPELFNAWGFERSAADVVSDRVTATQVNFGARTDNKPIDYVLWQDLSQDNFNPDQDMIAQLRKIKLATPGHFIIHDDKTTKVTPLFSSSNEAMLVDKRVVQFRNDPVALLTKYQAGTLSYPMAIRVQGTVKTAFPNGVKGKDGKLHKMPNHLDAAEHDIDVVAVADVDMLDDRFWVRTRQFYGEELVFNTSNNLDFLSNTIEALTGSHGLISVRARAGFSRPFHRVLALQREAEKRYRTKERELQKTLTETKQRIARMQVERSGSGEQVLNPEQQQEIAEFRALADETELELRKVQSNLRKDIETLDTRLKFINIGLVPAIVVLIAVLSGWLQLRRRSKGRSQH